MWRPMSMMLVVAVLVPTGLAACSSSAGANSVVGSFYPLAWAAEQIGGSRVSILDLTPPGVEAHDTNLNAKQVGQIQTARVVLLLGYLGFQPQVEAAARHADGDVVSLTEGFDLHPSDEPGLSADPHVWLDPVLMSRMTERIGRALERDIPGGRRQLEQRTRAVVKSLESLDAAYR